MKGYLTNQQAIARVQNVTHTINEDGVVESIQWRKMFILKPEAGVPLIKMHYISEFNDKVCYIPNMGGGSHPNQGDITSGYGTWSFDIPAGSWVFLTTSSFEQEENWVAYQLKSDSTRMGDSRDFDTLKTGSILYTHKIELEYPGTSNTIAYNMNGKLVGNKFFSITNNTNDYTDGVVESEPEDGETFYNATTVNHCCLIKPYTSSVIPISKVHDGHTIGGFNYNKCVNSKSDLSIGDVATAQLSFKARIDIEIGSKWNYFIKVNNDVPDSIEVDRLMGTFKVESKEKLPGGIYQYTLYDDARILDKSADKFLEAYYSDEASPATFRYHVYTKDESSETSNITFTSPDKVFLSDDIVYSGTETQMENPIYKPLQKYKLDLRMFYRKRHTVPLTGVCFPVPEGRWWNVINLGYTYWYPNWNKSLQDGVPRMTDIMKTRVSILPRDSSRTKVKETDEYIEYRYDTGELSPVQWSGRFTEFSSEIEEWINQFGVGTKELKSNTLYCTTSSTALNSIVTSPTIVIREFKSDSPEYGKGYFMMYLYYMYDRNYTLALNEMEFIYKNDEVWKIGGAYEYYDKVSFLFGNNTDSEVRYHYYDPIDYAGKYYMSTDDSSAIYKVISSAIVNYNKDLQLTIAPVHLVENRTVDSWYHRYPEAGWYENEYYVLTKISVPATLNWFIDRMVKYLEEEDFHIYLTDEMINSAAYNMRIDNEFLEYNKTFRDLFGYIASIFGGFAHCNSIGVFTISYFKPKESRFDPTNYVRVNLKSFTLPKINKIRLVNDNKDDYYIFGSGGSELIIQNNPLLLVEDKNNLLPVIGEMYERFQSYPDMYVGSLDLLYDDSVFAETGDIINIYINDVAYPFVVYEMSQNNSGITLSSRGDEKREAYRGAYKTKNYVKGNYSETNEDINTISFEVGNDNDHSAYKLYVDSTGVYAQRNDETPVPIYQ